MKYKVKLSPIWRKPDPLLVDWDYELIGDVLRAEFDEYFEEYKAEKERIERGSSKYVLKANVLDRFMRGKKINLIDDTVTGGLKSVFVLKPDQEKVIDERAYQTLKRLGSLLVFEALEEEQKKDPNLVIHNESDIDYFAENDLPDEVFVKPAVDFTKEDIKNMEWNAMVKLAGKYGLFTTGDTKNVVMEKLLEIANE